MSANPVVHFEMPYEDSDRVVKFYADAFGWDMQGTGAEMGNYVLATTTETGEDRRPKAPGTINGGFFPKTSGGPTQPSVVIAVDDIDAAMQNIGKAGGEVFGDVMDIPGVGKYVSFTDTEGNKVSLLQPSM